MVQQISITARVVRTPVLAVANAIPVAVAIHTVRHAVPVAVSLMHAGISGRDFVRNAAG
jgi:hypothetical protein